MNKYFEEIFQNDDPTNWEHNQALRVLKEMNFRGSSFREITIDHLRLGGLQVGDALFVLGKIKGFFFVFELSTVDNNNN